MKALGTHLIVELYECDAELINNLESLQEIVLESVRRSGAEIVKPVFHQFSPCGVSGVVVIAESHFSLHTWPEYGYCALDIFTCGDTIDNDAALHYLKGALQAQTISVMEMKRGMLNLPVEKIRHKPAEAATGACLRRRRRSHCP